MFPSSLTSAVAAFRLRPVHNRLLCLIRLPWRDVSATHIREFALVASPTAPYLRRLTIYRRREAPPSHPDTPLVA